jgi:hypothetical protein
MSLQVAPLARDEDKKSYEPSDHRAQLDRQKYPGRGTPHDPFVVDWDLGDPENPFNWSKRRKWLITLQVCTACCLVT